MRRVTQWLNENAHRAYPLVEDSNRNAGPRTLPDDVFLDFQLLEFEAEESIVYLQSITISGIIISFEFTYGTMIRSITIMSTAETYAPVSYGTAEPYRVTITLGPGIADVAAWGDGVYVFDDPPAFEPVLSNFESRHRVTSVKAMDPVYTDMLTGPVYIREGYNCRVAVFPDTDTVTVTAQRGAGAGVSCIPSDDGILLCSDVLLRVNGLVADNSGNFQFVGGPGVKIKSDKDSHSVIFSTGLNDINEIRCG